MKNGGVVSSRAGGMISKVELESDLKVSGDERIFIEACEAVNVFHHSSGPMKYWKEITEKLLGPSTDLMDRAIMLQYFFNRTAIAEPN